MRVVKDISEAEWPGRLHIMDGSGNEIPLVSLSALTERSFPLEVFVEAQT